MLTVKDTKNKNLTELEILKREFPQVEYVDAIFGDLHGYIRGKRFPIDEADKIYTSGVQMPDTAFFLDPTGDAGDPCGRGFSDGDPDSTLKPIERTTSYVPWGFGKGAQVLMQLYNNDGTRNYADPRQIASRVLERTGELGYRFNIAFELEFYLLDKDLDDSGKPQFPRKLQSDNQPLTTQVYSLTDLDNHHEFLSGVQEACQMQNVPASTTSSEFSPYQYEINLKHTDDPLAAADHCVLLRRIIKEVASTFDMRATFMAKPFLKFSGSGMHIHMSLTDQSGKNVFSGEDELGSPLMKMAIGGLLESVPDMFTIFSPGRNSFRRFVPDMFVPVNKTWGYNNRSVTIRIPAGPDDARRLEHRVAGADANPYLVLIALLGGVHHGITNEIDPGKADSYTNVSVNVDDSIPFDWGKSIAVFEKSDFAEEYFSREYVDLYCAVKRDEIEKYREHITDRDYQFYL